MELIHQLRNNNYKNLRLVGDDLNAHWAYDSKEEVKKTNKNLKQLINKIIEDTKEVEKSLSVPTSNDESIKAAKPISDRLLKEIADAESLGLHTWDTLEEIHAVPIAKNLLAKFETNYNNLAKTDKDYETNYNDLTNVEKDLLNRIAEDVKLPLLFLECKSKEIFRDPKPVAARLKKEVKEAQRLGLKGNIMSLASNVADKFDMNFDYAPSIKQIEKAKELAKATNPKTEETTKITNPKTDIKTEETTKTTNLKMDKKEIVKTGSTIGANGFLAFSSLL